MDHIPSPPRPGTWEDSSKTSDSASNSIPESAKDVKQLFNDLLKEKNVGGSASWEYALKLIGNDARFEMFRRHPERKQMFSAYKVQKAKDEREEQRLKAKRSKDNLEKLLQTSDKMSASVTYRKAGELFRDQDAWKAVNEQDRKEIFREVSEHLSKREKEEQKARRKRNMKVLSEILDSMTSICSGTTWQEAQQLLLDNPVFAEDAELLAMDKEDALIVFEEHIGKWRRTTRKRRKWTRFELCECSERTGNHPRFTSMLSQPMTGSNPLDLFKFYVEDLKARYEDEKLIIKDILKRKAFDVTGETTYDAFVDCISEDDRSGQLDAGNVKMVFERIVEKVREKEKERLREETRKRKKLESKFLHMLHDVEPAINEKSAWEEVRPLVCELETFKVIETEPERATLFHAYQEQMQESCSHHHSKSKKKKERKKEKSRKRSYTSSESDDGEIDRKGRRDRSRRRDSVSSISSSSTRSRSGSRDRSKRRSPSRSSSRSRRSYSPGSSFEKDERRRTGSGRTKSPEASTRRESKARGDENRRTGNEKNAESEASDIEELEKQRKMLLAQLAKHK
ncbi:Pre-mRNA-processing factor 40 -like protein A [Halotydeus destructor]|nr:Pre-mRNA-processing factor 40 -like protein A [Halotydeus destructor]